MITIIVASKNPVKIEAAREGFARMFPEETLHVSGVSVPSGVSDQPFSALETLQGAYQRALNARAASPAADYWVGIEGGVAEETGADACSSVPASLVQAGELSVFAWVVVLDAASARIGKGSTGIFYLPPKVAELVHNGMELGEADDVVFSRSNSKQGNGSVGLLTNDVIDRTRYYVDAVILALIPFRNPDLYPQPVNK
jgi:inosine/xanthosine triphosphatase